MCDFAYTAFFKGQITEEDRLVLSRGPGGASGWERHEGPLWGWTHAILVVMATPVFPDAATVGTGSVPQTSPYLFLQLHVSL